MGARFVTLVVAGLTALALAACGDPSGSIPGDDLERDTFDLVNGYRADQGLDALVWDETIAQVCRGHSQDMAAGRVDFGHAGFDDRVEVLAQTFNYASIAENVHHNFGHDDPAQTALEGWINSPPHHETMVGDFALSGLGVAEADPGEYYFTQMFLREQ